MTRKTLVHVPRELVRQCAGLLSTFAAWKRRPCTSLKFLIYRLNSLFDAYPLARYWDGFPEPAKQIRELERLSHWCKRALQSGSTDQVVARLEDMQSRESDCFSLLLFQVALHRDPKRPERLVRDRATVEGLYAMAREEPDLLLETLERVTAGLRPLKAIGRGGARHRRNQADRHVVIVLGMLFEDLTGKPPGASYKRLSSSDTEKWNNRTETVNIGIQSGKSKRKPHSGDYYSGRFIVFCQLVFEALGTTKSGRQVFELYRSIDIASWTAARARRQRWNKH